MIQFIENLIKKLVPKHIKERDEAQRREIKQRVEEQIRQQNEENRAISQHMMERIQKQRVELTNNTPFKGGLISDTKITFTDDGVRLYGINIEVVKKDTPIDIISALYPEYIFPLEITRKKLRFETNTGIRYSVYLDVSEEQANVLKQIIIKAQQ